MIINDFLERYNMSRYKLSKESGVPMTTIADICSGKAKLGKCSAETVHKIAKVFGVSVDLLLESEMAKPDYRCSFDVFKSNTCHKVKDIGDLDFIIETIERDDIRTFYEKKWYREALYTLAMIDYLSREQGIPLCAEYEDIRKQKLESPIYPASVIALSVACGDESIKEKALEESIPEFKRFNIAESEVRDVC